MRMLWLWIVFSAIAQSACYQAPVDNTGTLDQKIRAAYLKAIAGIDAPAITADTVLAGLQAGHFILVDVREDAERAVSQIPGALSPGKFTQAYTLSGPPQGKTVVAYCTIGYRSGKFAEKLIAQGIPVLNMEGGILAWVGHHGPLVHRDAMGVTAPTTQVHVYGKEWNLLPAGYQSVW